jgi:hypothetical protein
MKYFQKSLPHLLSLSGFILISLIYFYPVLQGKMILQSDIVQYTGMAKEQNDFRATTGEEPFWTNAAFGGMPTYQLGAQYPHNYVKKLDSALRFLPRPADYLFLYFLGFYVLLSILKEKKVSVLCPNQVWMHSVRQCMILICYCAFMKQVIRIQNKCI